MPPGVSSEENATGLQQLVRRPTKGQSTSSWRRYIRPGDTNRGIGVCRPAAPGAVCCSLYVIWIVATLSAISCALSVRASIYLAVAREVLLSEGIPFGYLVLAIGARHSYFGRDECAPHVPGLKSIKDATAMRSRTLSGVRAGRKVRETRPNVKPGLL
jgi:hypothetical protein